MATSLTAVVLSAQAQQLAPCLLLPLPPAERAAATPLIVEAEVRSARGEWDAGHRHLYTRQLLRVYRVLKGSLPDTTSLPLLVEGGQAGLVRQVFTNTLGPLPAGRQGLFFLYPAPWPGVAPAWATYASSQGFISYDLAANTAAEPARLYSTPAAAVAQTLALTGQPAQVLRPNPALAQAEARASRPTAGQRPQAVVISGFAPTQATAGTGTVLTLRGSGFGASPGSGGVEFRNADDGGATTTRALALDYLRWTDTEVQVRVPSVGSGSHPAGTGPVRLVADDGSSAETSTALTILYALTNVTDSNLTLVDRPSHVATNGAGGLTFQLAPGFAGNAAASAAWGRALGRWRCNTGVNWLLGAPAASDAIAADGVNAVAFDAGNTLPARVLGRTSSYYQGCYDPQGGVVFYVSEIDQQYSGTLPFQFGPATAGPGQYDFESVATHELGHAQQLNHLIRPGAVMHYAIAAAANLRTLNPASDVAGGRLVLRTRSFRSRGCGGRPMLPAPLTSLAATAGTASFTFTTRDECLVSGFVLERAAGTDTTAAGAGWQPVAATSASGSSPYALADAQPPAGLHYYRLGVRRPDGSLDYATPLLAGTATAPAAQVFPNPGTGELVQLAYPAAADGAVSLYLYDRVGRYLRGQRVTVQAGLNVVTLSAAGLTPGLYLLRIAGERTETVKVVRY